MRKARRPNRRILILLVVAGAFFAACGSAPSEGRQDPKAPFAAFYAAYEKADLAAALASLPQALRDASPYDAGTAALPPYQRDEPIYDKITAGLESDAPAAPAALSESAVHYALGVLAYGNKDWEAARRRLLLALLRVPRHRMAHIYLARIYGHLEEAALKTAKEGEDAGTVLMAKVGFGSSDQHIELAQEIVDRDDRPDLPALAVAFQYDKGGVKDFKAQWTTASGNARLQRQAANAEPGSCRVELCGPDRLVLDEKLFAPAQTIFWDGLDKDKKPIGGKTSLTTFPMNLELLSLTPGTLVVVYDPAGRKIFSAPAPAAEPAGLK